MASETIEVGGFDSILGAVDGPPSWVPAGFPVDGELWTFQEPDAVVIVQDGRLRVAAAPYTRQHDSLQILDNAKHMYFSTRGFEAPENGSLRVEWEMAAQIIAGNTGDLYDGFVSFHLMDLASGTAVDIFAGNETVASVHARLPFPGASAPPAGRGPRYFSLFREHRDVTRPGELHRYAMSYDRAGATLEFSMDGELLDRRHDVGPIGSCLIALGLMTEKDIDPAKGSRSCHGQGAIGTWGGIRVSLETA